MKKFYFLLFAILTLFSCRKDNEDSRAYAEGKITSSLSVDKIEVSITNNNIVIAKTNPKTDFSFKLSGPMMTTGISVVLNQKIKSFSAEQNGLSLSKDSMKIIVPQEMNYVKFNEIKLKQ